MLIAPLAVVALVAAGLPSPSPRMGAPAPLRQALVPSAPADAPAGPGDQAAFETTIAAINRSLSAAPTGRFDYAAYQNGAVIEPGIYEAGGLVLPPAPGASAVRLVARIPGTVIIRIPAGQYFLTVQGQVNAVQVDGITFVGGKGAFHFTYAGGNVNLMQSFTRNVFLDYTECAIANAAKDHPYLRVRDNVFMGARDAHTVGIAWGGYLDQGVIEDNAFLQDAYHLKLGPRLSSTMLVRHNDFLNWGGPVNRTRADVWILPNISEPYGVNSGFGFTITENKFGNENNSLDAPRILIANEDPASGPDRATRRPAGDDHGYLSQLVITGNLFNGGGAITAPVVRSAISELRNVEWRGNKFAGSPYAAILQWANPRTPSYTNTNSSFEFTPADVVPGNFPAYSFSNALFAQLRDYGGFFPGDPNALDLWPASDLPGLAPLGAGAQRQAFGGAMLRPAETTGHGLSLVSAPNAGPGQGVYANIGKPSLAAGGPVFLDIVLQRAPVRAAPLAVVELRNAADGAVALRRVVPLPAAPGNLRLPAYLPPSASPGAWQLRVYGGGLIAGQADSFLIGDWQVNTGNARLGHR